MAAAFAADVVFAFAADVVFAVSSTATSASRKLSSKNPCFADYARPEMSFSLENTGISPPRIGPPAIRNRCDAVRRQLSISELLEHKHSDSSQ